MNIIFLEMVNLVGLPFSCHAV